MRPTEVARLLLFVHALDQRHDTDDIRVQAWTATLDQECPRMEYRWAQSAASSHYAKDAGMLTVEHLIRGWKAHERTLQTTAELDAHCGRPGCACTHGSGCFKGWRDSPDGPTSPCPTCRAALSDILATMGPPGQRSQADMARLGAGR